MEIIALEDRLLPSVSVVTEQVVKANLGTMAQSNVLAAPVTGVANYSALVQGVTQVVSPGVPGPVFSLSPGWQAIVSGDADSTAPSTVVMAREYQAGRVVISSLGAMLSFDAQAVYGSDLLDNGRFLENMMSWLDVKQGKNVACATGHQEWDGPYQMAGLAQRLAQTGTQFSGLSSPITAAKLSQVSGE